MAKWKERVSFSIQRMPRKTRLCVTRLTAQTDAQPGRGILCITKIDTMFLPPCHIFFYSSIRCVFEIKNAGAGSRERRSESRGREFLFESAGRKSCGSGSLSFFRDVWGQKIIGHGEKKHGACFRRTFCVASLVCVCLSRRRVAHYQRSKATRNVQKIAPFFGSCSIIF